MIDYINEEQMKQWGMVWGLQTNKVKCKVCEKVLDYDLNKIGKDFFIDGKDLAGIVTCKECIDK